MRILFRNVLQATYYGLALLALGCAQRQPAPDTRAADEAAIRETEAACVAAAADKQADALVACYYGDDASVLFANAPIATGKEAITKAWAQLFETPGSSVSWQAVKVEVARSGDLAFSQGTYEITMNDPKGNPVTDRGKYVVVWKKQADGRWKALADIGNSDLPLPLPTP